MSITYNRQVSLCWDSGTERVPGSPRFPTPVTQA